jgi:hypothetical protein
MGFLTILEFLSSGRPKQTCNFLIGDLKIAKSLKNLFIVELLVVNYLSVAKFVQITSHPIQPIRYGHIYHVLRGKSFVF